MAGQRWDFAQAAVKIPVGRKNANSPIEIDHVRIGHAGRKAEIAGAFDPTTRVIRVSRFDSGIALLALARALVPDAVAGWSAASTRGAWRISGAGEIPVDRPENARWSGDVALDGDFVYASGKTYFALQKPVFAVRVSGRVVSISKFRAGLWDGTIEVPGMQVHLPSGEKQLRFETQLILSGARPQSISDSFNAGRKQPGAVPLDWKGAWRISAAGEIPLDHLENFRWRGDMALDGDLVYASGKARVALQKPTFFVRVGEQVVSISDLKAGLWEGNLKAPKTQIHLPSKDKKLRVETRLTLDGARPQSMFNSLSTSRKESGVVPLDWNGAWQFSGAGEIPMEQPDSFRLSGDLALDGDLVYASGETRIGLQKPSFSVRVEEHVVSLSDLKAGLWEGNLDAPKTLIHLPSKEKNLRIETQLTLHSGRKQPAVGPFTWNGAWRVSALAEVPADQPGKFRWNGHMALDGDVVHASGQTNVALRKPAFSVRADEQSVTISDFKASLWDGSLDAPKTLIHLPSEKKSLKFETQLTLSGARSAAVRKSFSAGQKQPRVVRLHWKDAWRINVAGEIPVERPGNFRWSGDAALGGDLVYANGETKVALRKPAFALRGDRQVVAITDFKAGLWEGTLSAPMTLVHLPSAKKKGRYETQLALKGARLQSIINSFGGAQPAPGDVQFDWQGGGAFGPASSAGSGALSIGGAEFARMPILGPLHVVFDLLAPGFRKDEPSTMTLKHRVSGGIFFLDDLKLTSQQVRVEAGGKIDVAREYAQFTAKGRLRRLPGIATVLLTFLLEFKGEGPVDDVRWRLKSIPGFHLIGKAAKKATRTEAVKGADRAVKGLLELPGHLLPAK